MNPVERAVRRIDTAQQRHRVTAFVFGVIKKYGDDNGGMLAANLAHSAFVTVFPLLLILVTVLVKVASGAASLRHEVLKAVAKQFPLVGDKLTGNIHALNRSSATSLIVGLLVLVWGAAGLAQAGPVHHGAGVEPARAGQARLPADDWAGPCSSSACSGSV